MEGSVIDLSKYRLESAKDDMDAAKLLYEAKQFKSSINRSYYAIFHCLRAVLALDGFDSSKHSGIIAFFNANYVKTGIFEKTISKNIDTAYRLREKADYVDFFVVSESEATEQYAKAEAVYSLISKYLEERWNNIQ